MAIGDTAKLIASLELQDKFSRPAAGITRSLGGMERGFSRIGRGAGQVASGLNTLGTRAALAAAGGLTAVVTTAASFEQAFTGVEKTVDGTAAQLAELEGVFRQMARTIPVSFEELAGIGEAGGALGIARQDLADFTDVVARLSVSTNLSSDQAATALGQLGNVLHLSGDDFRDFADSLVALGNAGASTEDQIVEMAARFGAAGNSAGLSKEEILALSSAVASMGIEVEAGGSALSRIFNNVTTNIGTSSAKAEAFADTLGLSAAEFRRSWERDALGTFQEFLGELNKLDQFEQASVLKSIGLTNTRDVNTVRLLAQNVGLVSDQLEVSREATGALNKESQKFFDTTQGRWKVTIANVRDVANTIGAELLPIVNDLSKEFVDFLQLDSSQAGIKTFAKDLAGGIRGLVTELKGTDFSGIIEDMKLAASVAKGAFDAFRSLPQPIQQLAIAALVANKVSGGAVGSIAGGLANIIGGTIKLAFPKLDIFGRGSPTNPMFVVPVGGAGLGGGTAAASGKAGSLVGGAAKFVLAPAAAAIIGHEIGQAVFFDPMVKPAVEFETSQFDKFIVAAKGDPEKLARGLATLEGGIHDIAGNTRDFIDDAVFGDQLRVLDEQVALTKQLLAEAKANAPQAGVGNNVPTNPGGTRTQSDPLGDAFLALVKRVPKNLLTGEVYREVANHIIALEEVQKGLIADGKTEAARHAQRNIDKLAALIGVVDRTRPILERTAERTSALSARMVEARAATDRGFSATNAQLGVQTSVERGILAKKTSFTANLTVPISTFINASLVQERIVQQQISMGHGFGPGPP